MIFFRDLMRFRKYFFILPLALCAFSCFNEKRGTEFVKEKPEPIMSEESLGNLKAHIYYFRGDTFYTLEIYKDSTKYLINSSVSDDLLYSFKNYISDFIMEAYDTALARKKQIESYGYNSYLSFSLKLNEQEAKQALLKLKAYLDAYKEAADPFVKELFRDIVKEELSNMNAYIELKAVVNFSSESGGGSFEYGKPFVIKDPEMIFRFLLGNPNVSIVYDKR